MTLHIVRLGSPRRPGEGTRIGTVRRPPRGVPKSAFAAQDWYDVWFPTLAPSDETLKLGQAATSNHEWQIFARHYRREISEHGARHAIELLATLSKTSNLAVGCCCENEERCHRSLLRELLRAAGATLE